MINFNPKNLIKYLKIQAKYWLQTINKELIFLQLSCANFTNKKNPQLFTSNWQCLIKKVPTVDIKDKD